MYTETYVCAGARVCDCIQRTVFESHETKCGVFVLRIFVICKIGNGSELYRIELSESSTSRQPQAHSLSGTQRETDSYINKLKTNGINVKCNECNSRKISEDEKTPTK